MEVVNSKFASLDDLRHLDTRISELLAIKESISEAVKAKTNGGNDTNKLLAMIPDNSGLQVENVLQEVKFLVGVKDSDEVAAKLREMRREYGDLGLFDTLDNLFARKNMVESRGKLLEKACGIESDLVAVNEKDEMGVESLVAIKKRIDEIYAECESEISMSNLGQQALYQLIDVFEYQVNKCRRDTEDLLKNLLQIEGWLAPDKQSTKIDAQTVRKLYQYVGDLLQLQTLIKIPEYPETWWAIELLLEPIIVRFNYHFNSKKETNKISKPEWALNFVEKFLSENLDYFNLIFGEPFTDYTAILSFDVITGVLQPVRQKLFKMVSVLNKNIVNFHDDPENLEKSGRLLSHLIFEILSFDQRLRTLYNYNPFVKDLNQLPSQKWMGLIGDILLKEDRNSSAASNWLNFEQRLAMERFNSEILAANNSFKVDLDYQLPEQDKDAGEIIPKPTYSASNLVKLFDNLTNHHKHLNIVKYQLKYVSTIQLRIIDLYCDKLKRMFKRVDESLGLKLVFHLIPGGLNKDTGGSNDATGSKTALSGVESLTELFCLTRFIGSYLKLWSEELVFVQLWNSYKSISDGTHPPDSTIFDSSISEYRSLENKIINSFNQFFRKQIKSALKNYVNATQWDTVDFNHEPSADLSLLIHSLPNYLNHVRNCVSHQDYYFLSNNVVHHLCRIFYDFVITNNHFSPNGITQLQLDFNFVVTQLKYELLLAQSTAKPSNIDNFDFIKVNQCLDFMKNTPISTGKKIIADFNYINHHRQHFEHRLDRLLTREIQDLVHRIV